MFVTVRTLEAARAQAIATAREDFERTVAILREENSTLRRMLDAADRRVDALTTDLVKSLVTVGHSAPSLPAAPPARTSRDPIEGFGNVFAPIPFDHPDATFTNERAASLMFAEEKDGAAPASG